MLLGFSNNQDPFTVGLIPEHGLFHYGEGGGGGGGGAGNLGGGAVKLSASNKLLVSGQIVTKGKTTSAGNGGSGSWSTPAGGGSAASTASSSGGSYGSQTSGCGCCQRGGSGGTGGAGAGGGVSLVCGGPFGVTVTGSIDTRGGGGNTSNFGSLKVFAVKGQVNLAGTINAGWNGAYGTPYNPQNKNWVHPVC